MLVKSEKLDKVFTEELLASCPISYKEEDEGMGSIHGKAPDVRRLLFWLPICC